MTALLVLLLLVGFILIDVLVRSMARRRDEARLRRERQAALETRVRLEFDDEARSLERVELPRPRARILAVDDEPVVLDSLRKILVLEGYSVDTVQSGPEALGLVRRRDYDFVFTDIKMPGMDGVEVVKGVRQLRPDVDVVVITGYGTIETAVETMQHGAVDYVQKPFTAEELAGLVRKLVIRREARLEAEHQPAVRVVVPAVAESAGREDYCVAGGFFLSAGHVWARLEPGGQVRVGVDDFARKALGPVERLELPEPGCAVDRGAELFGVVRGGQVARFHAPLSGNVVETNGALAADASPLRESPYERGWVCVIEPADLAAELALLRIGRPAVDWYREEITRLGRLRRAREGGGELEPRVFESEFLAAPSFDESPRAA
jgi:CheY-like chemotaxis protein